MSYFIDENLGSPVTQPFLEFTDTITAGGSFDCGNRVYTMTLSEPSLSPVITLNANGGPLDVRELTI